MGNKMKKVLLALFLCLIPCFVSAESSLIIAVRQGHWEYIDREMNFSHEQGVQQGLLFNLFHCNKSELRILRNAIYARHGFKFNAPDLQQFFSQLEWYKGTKENVFAELTENEKSYIELISRIEDNYPVQTDERLVGYWADERHMPYFTDDYSSFDDFYRFWHIQAAGEHFEIFASGTFYYREETSYLLYEGIYGLWSLNNNVLTITPISDNKEIFGNFSSLQNKISRNLRFREYVSDKRRVFLECNLMNNATRWIKYDDNPRGRAK
jgi:hypothetical protein